MGIEITDEQKKALIEGKITTEDIIRENTKLVKLQAEAAKKIVEIEAEISKTQSLYLVAKQEFDTMKKHTYPTAKKRVKDLKLKLTGLKLQISPNKKKREKKQKE
jgi:hypothetical protein